MSETRSVQQTWYRLPLPYNQQCGACGDVGYSGAMVWSLDPQMPKRWVCDNCMNNVIDPAEVSC